MAALAFSVDPDELVESELAVAAREDPSVFCDYVLRDEKSGAPVESAPVHRDWQRLASTHSRLIIQSAIELGKTSALAVGRVLYELGRDPNQSVLVVCNTAGQSAKIAGLVARYVEHSPELRRVFPSMRPDSSGPWNQTTLTLSRTAPSKDPSLQAIGVHGNILGARVDLLVVDDPCDYENTRSTAARDDLSRWFDSTVLGRLTADARVIVVGNPWHRDDLLARLAQRAGWHSERYAITTRLGRSRWPERWPASRVESVRRDLGPREAARQLDCLPPDDADPVIGSELVLNALRLGENATTEHFASAMERGDVVVLGVDTAQSEKRTADESALVLTRTRRSTGLREVTQVTAGRWGFDELVGRIVNQCELSRAVAAIETNGGGEYVAQQVERRVPVVRLPTTGPSKRMRVEMLASELAGARWSLRQPGFLPDDMRKLAQEAMAFSYEDHCGDRLAAWLVAIEAIRQREQRRPGRWVSLDMLSR